jgi:7-carboxy-7-deazaguanine synthase
MRISSIFLSIDGEVNSCYQGGFSTFIRLAGCDFAGHNVHCTYCDTKWAQSSDAGKEMSIKEVIEEVERIGCDKVTITGGEPLRQGEDLEDLIFGLQDLNYLISIETNGSYYPYYAFGADSIIMDWKLSNAGIVNQYMNPLNFKRLGVNDFVKMVISDKASFKEAITVMENLVDKGCAAEFALSPMAGVCNPQDLIEWCKEEKLFGVIINLQLHKIIYPSIKEGEER